jgi:diguanylate cyclase (GGDEF)-like protein/putative nucleotidyltransferase with HDIG domain
VGAKKTRRILVIDDSAADIILLKKHLQRMGLDVLSAEDGLQGMETALAEHPDVILLDIMMPGIDGFEVCKRLKADTVTSAIPVVFVSAKDQSCDKIAGLNVGATDYITKPYDGGELKARIESVLRNLELQEQLSTLAVTDELTGLGNRRYFFDILEREMFKARMEGSCLSLMMLDSDHFKKVNDTYGHIAGDDVLKQMGKILKENVSSPHIPARYGGGEFAVLMPQTAHLQAVKTAEGLRQKIDQWQWKIDGEVISVTVSIGLAYSESYDSRELIARADKALRAAKKQGRNRFVCWEEIGTGQGLQIGQPDEYREFQHKIGSLAGDLRTQFLEIITAFLKAIEIKDPYTAAHSRNVQAYAAAIAEEMDVSEELKERLATAALLHDLGKVGMFDRILQKTDPLNEHDKRIVEQHSKASEDILRPIGIFNQELLIIRQHHEKFNGTGYPDGLGGEEICIAARILAIADVFDAITSQRPYHSAMSLEEAIMEITDRCESQFDPEVVEAFKRANEKYKNQWPLSDSDSMVSLIEKSIPVKK